MSTKTRYLLWLAALSAVDIVIPVPIIGLALIYVVLERPAWFREAVTEIYRAA